MGSHGWLHQTHCVTWTSYFPSWACKKGRRTGRGFRLSVWLRLCLLVPSLSCGPFCLLWDGYLCSLCLPQGQVQPLPSILQPACCSDSWCPSWVPQVGSWILGWADYLLFPKPDPSSVFTLGGTDSTCHCSAQFLNVEEMTGLSALPPLAFAILPGGLLQSLLPLPGVTSFPLCFWLLPASPLRRSSNVTSWYIVHLFLHLLNQ
jgi:hypothetical protein